MYCLLGAQFMPRRALNQRGVIMAWCARNDSRARSVKDAVALASLKLGMRPVSFISAMMIAVSRIRRSHRDRGK